MDMEERTASLKSPLRITTGSRAFMSLDTHRKGTISRSKSPSEAAVAGAKSSVSAMSIGVDEIRFVTRNRLPELPRFIRTLIKAGLWPICR